MAAQTTPELIFGGGMIGHIWSSVDSVEEILNNLKELSILRIDTAGRYPHNSPGLSETLLGESKAAEKGFIIDSKIMIAGMDSSGTLSASKIATGTKNCLERLKVDSVNVLYCHTPDYVTPLAEQAEALNLQFKKGHFKKLGLSNFPPEMLEEFISICEQKEFVKPSVYQGQYNLVCRSSESSLFPLLRKHGIVFNAYSPLARGFLTGKLTRGEAEGTRLAEGNPLGSFYRPFYNKDEMHSAIRQLDESATKHGIPITDAAIRWIYYHSTLKPGDGIILGGSKISHIQQNVKAIKAGPLPQDVVQIIEEIWTGIANIAS